MKTYSEPKHPEAPASTGQRVAIAKVVGMDTRKIKNFPQDVTALEAHQILGALNAGQAVTVRGIKLAKNQFRTQTASKARKPAKTSGLISVQLPSEVVKQLRESGIKV